MTWELVWQIVFVVIIVAFAILSVLVSVFGALDIKQMLKELKDQDDQC